LVDGEIKAEVRSFRRLQLSRLAPQLFLLRTLLQSLSQISFVFSVRHGHFAAETTAGRLVGRTCQEQRGFCLRASLLDARVKCLLARSRAGTLAGARKINTAGQVFVVLDSQIL